jgi:hypothetical protein
MGVPQYSIKCLSTISIHFLIRGLAELRGSFGASFGVCACVCVCCFFGLGNCSNCAKTEQNRKKSLRCWGLVGRGWWRGCAAWRLPPWCWKRSSSTSRVPCRVGDPVLYGLGLISDPAARDQTWKGASKGPPMWGRPRRTHSVECHCYFIYPPDFWTWVIFGRAMFPIQRVTV